MFLPCHQAATHTVKSNRRRGNPSPFVILLLLHLLEVRRNLEPCNNSCLAQGVSPHCYPADEVACPCPLESARHELEVLPLAPAHDILLLAAI